MSANYKDFQIHKSPYSTIPTITVQQQDLTSSSLTAINAGDCVKMTADGSQYVAQLVDGDVTIGTDGAIVGIAASDSTATAAADGTLEVYLPLPGIIWKCKVTTSTNFDTEAEILALVGDAVTVDVSGVVTTIDENDGHADTNAFQIVGGDPETATAYFTIAADATWLGGATIT